MRIQNIFTLCGNYRELSQHCRTPMPGQKMSEDFSALDNPGNYLTPVGNKKMNTFSFENSNEKENYNPSDSKSSDLDVYVNWEASRDNPGKFITTLKNKNIRSKTLPNSLAGTVDGWFFLLPGVQQVDLANNSFTRVEIWKPTNPNSNLIAVDLGFNRIEGYLAANFAAYPLLSSLSMRYNRLRGPIPWEYGEKESLKRLFLDGNFLNGSPPEGFFKGSASVSGSLGDNCLQKCPASSQLCLKSQKPSSICQHVYGGKPKS